MRRNVHSHLIRIGVVIGLCFTILATSHPLFAGSLQVDVAVYGGTPGGIASALAAARHSRTVVLVEPYSRVGGLVTNGLSHTDYHSHEGLSGIFLEFTERVHDYYRGKYGEASTQALDCRRGTNAEPHVNQIVFEQMLKEAASLRVLTRHRLAGVAVVNNDGGAEPARVESADFLDADGGILTVQARIFIDATYEGDLMAAAGIPYAIGREGRNQYGESLALTEADDQVQGYNFRLVVTRDAELRVMPKQPLGYQREDYAPVIDMLQSGQLKSVFCDSKGGIYKAHMPMLPNSKHDVNDVSRGLVRLSMPDLSDGWPDGDAVARGEIFAAHVRHNVGMLYFLQNDEAVPKAFRDEARQYGWCRDEFTDDGHIPEQLYIREARRMIGLRVFTERDTEYASGDGRAKLHFDSIAIGEYSHNCHGTDHEGPRIGGRHTGEFYKGVAPYQIPYGTLVPRTCANVLVPVACSSSHVGFCALRLEPIWTSLGQAAGEAAHLAIEDSVPVQRVAVAQLQKNLHAAKSATIYTPDIAVDSPDFTAVQWWGTAGGFRGLAAPPAKPGQRGQNITSQYFLKYPDHDVDLSLPFNVEQREKWLKLAESLGVDSPLLPSVQTRGEFIRHAFQNVTH